MSHHSNTEVINGPFSLLVKARGSTERLGQLSQHGEGKGGCLKPVSCQDSRISAQYQLSGKVADLETTCTSYEVSKQER